MTFLKTILFIILGIYLLRILVGLFLPFALKKLMERLMRQTQARGGSFHESASAREGEVTISQNPSGKKDSDRLQGEYVDFEEIK